MKYLHIVKTVEGVGYCYKNYPQIVKPNLTKYQEKELEKLGIKCS